MSQLTITQTHIHRQGHSHKHHIKINIINLTIYSKAAWNTHDIWSAYCLKLGIIFRLQINTEILCDNMTALLTQRILSYFVASFCVLPWWCLVASEKVKRRYSKLSSIVAICILSGRTGFQIAFRVNFYKTLQHFVKQYLHSLFHGKFSKQVWAELSQAQPTLLTVKV